MSKAEIISEAQDNSKWIDANYEALVHDYDGNWVAVLEHRVIDADKNLDEIMKRLRRNLGDKYSGVVVEYISSKPLNMVLFVL
jgi:hypothetical protein